MADNDSDYDSDAAVEAMPNAARPPQKRLKLGQRSIHEIIENASADRLSTKIVSKQLQFGYGAPSTRRHQDLWVERVSAFLINTLKKSLDKPFNGEDLIRFFSCIIGKLRSNIAGKTGISMGYIGAAFDHLMAFGSFSYPDFNISAHEKARLHTFFDDEFKAGRLYRGLAQQRVFITCSIMNKLGRDWLKHHEDNGTANWDVTLAQLMSIVLMASLGCRAGDISRSEDYHGDEYLKWKNIELTLRSSGTDLTGIEAIFTLPYTKAKKKIGNADRVVNIKALTRPGTFHLCPMHLLLIHALRHGLVYGSTIQEVMAHTHTHPTRQVQWRHPERAVTVQLRHACQCFTGRLCNQVHGTNKWTTLSNTSSCYKIWRCQRRGTFARVHTAYRSIYDRSTTVSRP